LLESLRAAVDEPALDALLSEGRALPLPDAVAYALGGDGLT
jgi:hypothetical protein